ncbi:MAG: peptidoglycan editing factor PgeF [Chlorobiaceae bacterium]|nr:peptidoglycan editing factor PgeF [Chlorobiaceae bacterium]
MKDTISSGINEPLSAFFLSNNITPTGVPPKFIVPESFRKFKELLALQSTRTGGVSEEPYSSLNLGINTEDSFDCVHENTCLLCRSAHITPESLVSSVQVHGTEILFADKPGKYHGYDAFITDRNNLFLCILTADCYPVLLYDPQHQAAGAVHAGWKGSAGKIVMKTIAAMQTTFKSVPEECFAFIGTGISANAYEVSLEVAREFPLDSCRRSPFSREEEKYLLDLSLVNYQQLLASGIPASNIERSHFCSYADSSMFFSYRRDQGKTGRMVSLIGLR